MTIDRQLLTFMPHTVTISPFTSFNNYGEPTTGTSRTASAYVVPNKVVLDGADTREENQPVTIYIADTNIGIRDTITLPDGTVQFISSLERHVEVTGLEHTIVTVK
jgi:hypothetical protein